MRQKRNPKANYKALIDTFVVNHFVVELLRLEEEAFRTHNKTVRWWQLAVKSNSRVRGSIPTIITLTRSSKYFPVPAIMLLLRKTTCACAVPYQSLTDRPSHELCYSDCCTVLNEDYRASLPANRCTAFEEYLGKSRRHEPRVLREDLSSILCRVSLELIRLKDPVRIPKHITQDHRMTAAAVSTVRDI